MKVSGRVSRELEGGEEDEDRDEWTWRKARERVEQMNKIGKEGVGYGD